MKEKSMDGHLRVSLDPAKFAEIPLKAIPRTVRLQDPELISRRAIKWMFIGYSDKLLNKNEKFQTVLTQFSGRRDAPECWTQLTAGQRILYALSALDGQINNGGVTQFFWNCPDLIFPAYDALTALGYSELTANYEQALERLLGQKARWSELRQQAVSQPDTFWETYQTLHEELDLDWFDEWYFKQAGPELIGRLVHYVQEHPEEFIEPSVGS